MALPHGATDEHGSVSIVAAALTALAIVLALFSVDVWQVLAAKGRAQTAADAAALAAGQELVVPSARSPTELADQYATDNGAELVSCECDPGSAEAVVTVARTVSLSFLGGTRTLTATARAVIDDGG